MKYGDNTKAAALAIIHEQTKLAQLALRSSSASPAHRELSLALAGYNKGTVDETWEETVRDLADHLEDPYARAILALVRSGDWHDVLAETTLPLRDRVGVALMYLNDFELKRYINNSMTECIREGDVEGVVLTGLTEQAVPLFENYIQKFSDLQTAVLAMSFTCPRYFADSRVDLWRATYQSHLNSWGRFVERSRFDIQSKKLSKPPGERPQLQPASRQVSLRCNNCEQVLDRNPLYTPPTKSLTSHGTHPEKILGNDKSGTSCPKCGRHMPYCVLCMGWLGMPNPHTKGSMTAGLTGQDSRNIFIDVCRTCWHMSHGIHALEWFTGNNVCPVPECECRCKEIDFGRA